MNGRCRTGTPRPREPGRSPGLDGHNWMEALLLRREVEALLKKVEGKTK
jgi:hypothetical protein